MPILDLFWTILIIFLWFAWLMVVFNTIVDLFRNDDMGGVAKGFWALFIILVPWLGVLIYLITQSDGMARRQAERIQASDEAARAYIQQAAGTTSTADELEKLAALRDNGTITAAEFDAQKARLLA